MSINNVQYFPAQTLSYSEKNEKWSKDCMDAAERIVIFNSNTGIRETYYNKTVNYNLFNGIVDPKDVDKAINPLGILGAKFPGKFQNYPIAVPKINLLLGEESKRAFEWKVMCVNPDAITEKEEKKTEQLMQTLVELAQDPNLDEKQVEEKMQRLQQYQKYSYMDARELMATQTLKYLWYKENIPYKFNQGFADALITAEEIYCCDVVANEPILRKVNPLYLFTLRSGVSPYVEDSDIIVEQSYHPIGYVIDNYYEYLTKKDIQDIEQGHYNSSSSGAVGYKALNPLISIEDYVYGGSPANLIEVNVKGTRYFSGAYDAAGNIRVTRIVWRSRKKIGILKYFDENGQQQETVVNEFYKINESRGEFIDRWMWINEWWEGTKIGMDIYVKIQPRPIQFRSMNNLSASRPGYVGTYYNVNSSKARSLMDMMKPYQYLYDIFMYRVDKAFATYKGPMIEVDLAKVPDEWTPEKWMYMGEATGYLFVDSFREGNKGVATGKLAGNFNTTGKVFNPDMGRYISDHLSMLQHIKEEIGQIAGVTQQREGQIQNRETVGGTERSVLQSSLITEKYFYIHDNLKVRVLTDLLETAKYCWRNGNKKVQYVLDDMTSVVADIDGELLNESEFGIFVSSAAKDIDLFNAIKSLGPQLVQAGKMRFSSLMKTLRSDSISQITREIEELEVAAEQQEQQNIAAQQEAQNAQIQLQNDIEQQKLDLARYKIDEDNRVKLEVAEMQSYMGMENRDLDNDGVPDTMELSKLALEQQKHSADVFTKSQEQYHKDKVHKDEISLREKELALKDKEITTKAKTEKFKAETSLKIARANKNKFDSKKK